MNSTPVSLLEKLRQPDQAEAWQRFVDLYTPLLYAWSRRAGLSTHEAADLVQDVFVVLLQKLPTFTYDQKGSFRAWLRTVLNHKLQENRRRRRPQLANDSDGWPEPAAPGDATEELAEREYHEYLIGRAFALIQHEFEPHVWQAAWKFVVEGQSAAAVAAELGVSRGVVYNAKHRVLHRVRLELAGLW